VRLLALCVAASSCLAACIERPYEGTEPQPRRAQVDRSTLRDVLEPAPADATPVGAVFGNVAELVAYKLEPPQLVTGQRSRLTLYWRCRGEMEAWHIFVHLDNAAGERIHAEHDPAAGRFPTDAWRPGDSIADTLYFIPGREPLLLYLGFYSQGDNRLPVTSAGKGRDDGTGRLFAGALPLAH
jgi:hypothetical protein